MPNPKLELFYFKACPYCQIVLQALDSLKLKIEHRDITKNEADLNRLVADTGRRTVPCLYIDNQPMFESAEIVNWLQMNAEKLDRV